MDAQGNLDQVNTGPETVTFCVNTKSGKVKLKATGQVPNESGATQRFDLAAFPEAEDFLTRVKYRVKASGAAKLTASGRADPNDLP